ncbi:MAG TPA: hypothetical protein VMU26_09900, partial [Candidatus Polarisedimenticolia bacterium]|nr:hypothetical protein [Candidatus Polarisedimenticolia bacterium]
LPASAFMLAGTVAAGNSLSTATSSAQAATAALSGTGTTDFLPLWTNSGALGATSPAGHEADEGSPRRQTGDRRSQSPGEGFGSRQTVKIAGLTRPLHSKGGDSSVSTD